MKQREGPARYERMTKPQLLAELRRLEAAAHELEVFREETRVQNEQLVEFQHSLEESRDRYADLYDFAPIAYVTLGPIGQIEEINLTGASLLGTERSRIVGNPLLVYVAEEDRPAFLAFMKRCRDEQGLVVGELTLAPRGQTPIVVQLSARGGPKWQGGGMSFRTAITDLTERKKAEEERRKLIMKEQAASQANEAKDRFIAMLSHELRTPLTPVLAVVSALETRSEMPETLRTDFSMIRRNVELEVRLIDDLLDVTRIARNKVQLNLEVLDVHQLIEEVVESCRADIEARRLSLSLGLAAKSHHVYADAVRLRQVFWNLLKNAIKFTAERQSISIRSINGRADGADGEGVVRVLVSDTGIGMDPRQVDRLFLPFEQEALPGTHSNPAGLGLGLAIAKALVEAQGGSIRGISRGKGRGSTFEVEMRTTPTPGDAPTRHAAPEAASDRCLSILVVEDHLDTARVMARLLTGEGHQVELAGSKESALTIAQQADFDLIISDLGLPDGSGLDLMRQLSRSRHVCAIALSGFGAEQDVRKSREAGFTEHITKPVDFEKLLEAIGRVVERGTATEGG